MTPSAPSPAGRRICVVLKGWPRISTTFIAQELVGLEQQEGMQLWVAAMRYPVDNRRHKLHDRLQAPVHYLPEYLYREPLRVLRGWWQARRLPGYKTARRTFLADLRRDCTSHRVRRFGQALVLAAEMPADIGLIYAQFIHTPGAVGRYAAQMRALPLAGSAHARDIWTTSHWDKAEKLAEMRFCATCTAPGAVHLRQLADDPAKIHLIYHGLDFSRFPTDPPQRPARDGRDPADPIQLLSIGRAVEKKGFDVLLRALAALPADLHWRWHHVGDGDILKSLKALAGELGLQDRLTWHGTEDHSTLLQRYRDADLFVLPSREAGDGDRDGLPNVLMEAQTQALACLSTNFSAIPELIQDGETGRLVPPADLPALTAALDALIRDPAERKRLGDGGYARVRSHFGSADGVQRIAGLLRAAMAA